MSENVPVKSHAVLQHLSDDEFFSLVPKFYGMDKFLACPKKSKQGQQEKKRSPDWGSV